MLIKLQCRKKVKWLFPLPFIRKMTVMAGPGGLMRVKAGR